MAVPDFVCPRTRKPLTLSADNSYLESLAGDRYEIVDGIPDLVTDIADQHGSGRDQDYYRTRAAEYDRGNDAMFGMLLADEEKTRNDMVEMLGLRVGARVLEIGCGTCRDTVHLLARGVTLYASDLSREMILIGRDRLKRAGADFSRLTLFRADAVRLPFPDGFFDAAFHFGGLNLFSGIADGLTEIARVVRHGGRVVAGDEGVGPWLENTDFARFLKNSNPLFSHTAPLEKIPTNARNVACRWILNGSFYLIAFDVGEGEPSLDLDLQFPGRRGGSHRTRYFGKLEGVSPELRAMVSKAAEAEGISIVAWLEKSLRQSLRSRSD